MSAITAVPLHARCTRIASPRARIAAPRPHAVVRRAAIHRGYGAVRPAAAPATRAPRLPTRCRPPPRASASGAEPAVQSRAASTFASIKRFGAAGTLSYILTEVAVWALALPGAAFGYHASTGEWLSWDTDRAQLAALAATFVTGVRFGACPPVRGLAWLGLAWLSRPACACSPVRGISSLRGG